MLNALVRLLESLQHALNDMGGWAILAFALVFFGVQFFMLPGTPLGLAAGFFFGFGKGWLALNLGCFLGATINFWIARSAARGWVQRKFGSHEKFRVIDSAIGREGWKIVALLRFVPIPYGLSNYCYGLTPVRYLPYIIATMLAIQPANCLFLWIGAESQGELATVLGKGRPRHPLEYAILVVGAIAAVIALAHIAKIAHATVSKGEKEADQK